MSEKLDFSHLDWYENRFKAVDVITLQNAIAKALSELIDTPLQCWISDIDFEGHGADSHKAKFHVSLSKPLGHFPSEEELAAEAASV